MPLAPDQHFQNGGGGYAAFRPTYPKALAERLAQQAPNRSLALDVGCGTGQLSVLLAEQFERVEAVDVSADQLAHAEQRGNLRYQLSPAESLPFADASMALVSVGQAAHWFDLPRFYVEAQRVAQPGALLGLRDFFRLCRNLVGGQSRAPSGPGCHDRALRGRGPRALAARAEPKDGLAGQVPFGPLETIAQSPSIWIQGRR
jgi:SAM-dependent methyltransferase